MSTQPPRTPSKTTPSNNVAGRQIKDVVHFAEQSTVVFRYEDGGQRIERVDPEPERDDDSRGGTDAEAAETTGRAAAEKLGEIVRKRSAEDGKDEQAVAKAAQKDG